MEIIKKGKNIIIKHSLKRGETYKINQTSKFQTISIYKKPQILYGIASATEDNHDVLFIDYDTPEVEIVKKDYKSIQRRFKLPQGYLLKTNKGYHVICLKKFLPHKIYTILSYTHCDSAYMSMPLRNKYRNWILRINPKKKGKRPEFIGLIGEQIEFYGDYGQVSKSHKNFLSKIYPNIKHPKYSGLDKLNKIYLEQYESTG